MKLNEKNYYTISNRCITSSKLKDLQKLGLGEFYEKHVLHQKSGKYNPSFAYGSLLDALLSDREDKFEEESKRSNQSTCEIIKNISSVVKSSREFANLEGHERQPILFYKEKIGIFDGLAGIPDYLDRRTDEVVITDLKSTAAVNKLDFYYHCQKYGYFFQQAFYQRLLRLINPKIKTIKSQFLVVHKRSKGGYLFYLQPADQKLIDAQMPIVDKLIDSLRNEYNFGKKSIWGNLNSTNISKN